ncbi:hypothetical protein LTS15_010676 [Exophiala xenobiotica]|nr:hypothetical protein LTS15_010676 [Exophiala xenobiotica]
MTHKMVPLHVEKMKDEPGHLETQPREVGMALGMESVDKSKILRKMDLRIIPVLTILYLFAFLDRGNIGNAKVLGMAKDLGLAGNEYNLCLTVFFFPYIFFEIPSNLLLKRLRPSIWLPSIVAAWGIVTICMGLVHSYHGLLICRVFLGLTEAGLYPGVAYYLTMWYCPSDLGYRQAVFFSAASGAGAFSGLLAYAINKMDGIGNYAGWRWIFIIEGLATVVVAILAFFTICDFPDTAKFLSAEERTWILHQLKYHGSKQSNRLVEENDKFQWKFVRRAVTDWQIYLAVLSNWGASCVIYGISFFLPTIINELGYTSTASNILTIPMYVAAAIATIVTAFFSDKYKNRGNFVLALQLVTLAGFVMAVIGSGVGGVPGVVYAGVFLATCSCYPAYVLIITWIANNLAPAYKRGAGVAFLIGMGNFSGAMASNFYRTQDSPQFLLGHGVELGFVVLALLADVVLIIVYKRINKKRELACQQELAYTNQELSDKGDRAVTFRYQL